MSSGKLQEWALIAEIVGAVAVVVSLVYVGASVQQNTRAIMVANHQALVAMDQDKNDWFRDVQFTELFLIASDDINKLNPVQLLQFRTFAADTFNGWEFAFITYNNGMMDQDLWRGWESFYRNLMQQPAFQWFWTQAKSNFSDDFRRHVDAVPIVEL